MSVLAAVEGVEHRWVDAAGLRVHVACAGTGEPLVMLHGWPQNWFEFRHLIPRLSERYQVICPDLRGLGETDAPPRGYEKAQLVADLERVLDALGLESVRLVGHDWGSIVGFMFAVARPERLVRYVAMGGAHLWPKVDLRAIAVMWRFWYQLAISLPGVGPRLVANTRFVRLLYRLWAAPGFAWAQDDLRALTAGLDQPARARATSLIYRTWITREMPRLVAGAYRSARLEVPTLFLHGELDGCIDPLLTRGGRRHAPQMRVEILPGVGHFVPEEAPELVLQRLLKFFA